MFKVIRSCYYGSVSDPKRLTAGNIMSKPDDMTDSQYELLISNGFITEVQDS